MTENIYKPSLMTVKQVIEEAPGIRTLRLIFQDEERGKNFAFKAGQFGEYSAFGDGECPFCIASSPTRKGYIECSLQLAGKVTTALSNVEVGDTVGFRGPYGNWFPIEQMEDKNLVFVAGGIGLAPVRCLIWNCLDLRDKFRKITIVYGARTVDLLVYKRELEEWSTRGDVSLLKTVDPGGETTDWDGQIGFVPTVLEQSGVSSENAIAVVCGPPIMIKFTLPVLQKLGFDLENVYTTLENRMKCGLGKCGRCNIGGTYVCKDGPVFSAARVVSMPDEY